MIMLLWSVKNSMKLSYLIKRGILPLLVFLPLSIFAMDKNLYEDKVWKNLLHLDKNDNPYINTPTFLFSYDNFSSKDELEKTLQAFQKDKRYICKFPARYLWLTQNNATDIKFDLQRCTELEEYKKNTNPHNISLVFVSEDVSTPTSMMGHIFFKLDGINHKGNNVENTISFFTIIDTINLPYLAIESTIIGMKGYFVLKPYHKQIEQYTKDKNRNIWEYSLDLNKEQIKLLSYHFWELKNVDITYYFTGYNCATIVDDMLNIVSKSSKKNSFNLWLTPKDVIKKATIHNLIKDTKVRNNTTLDKNPILSQNDSQISISKIDNENALYISFLPASHTLFDDNRQYESESSLKIGEFSLKLEDDNIKLDELNLFTMQSLVPWNKNKILSKELEISYTKSLDEKLNIHHIYNLSYSTGITYKISNDIFLYDLLGLGLAYGDDKTYLYGKNQLGLIIYEIFDMKTTLQYTSYYNNFQSKKFINTFDITQSIKFDKNIRVDLGYHHNQTNSFQDESFRVGVSYLF